MLRILHRLFAVKAFLKQKAIFLCKHSSVASVRCMLSIMCLLQPYYTGCLFILFSAFVCFAAPAYFLSNDTPE